MKVVIIGNGAAGNQAADTIRNLQHDTELLIISQENFPTYSACALPDCMAGWVERSRLFIKQEKDYEQAHIDIRLGAKVLAVESAKKQLLLDDDIINYDRLILACGSRPIVPSIKGSGLIGNYVLKSVSDLDAIIKHCPGRVVVVGSGNIGIEVAEALQIRGAEVFLIELLERVMPRFLDEKPASMLQEILEEHNITVLCGERVKEVSGSAKVEAVITDKQTIICDTVIWAVGVKQNIELALAAGIEIGELGGIKVNRYMETSVADIFACGDCIESYDLINGVPVLSLLWPSAKRQAEIAALNALGLKTEYEGSFDVVVEEIYGVTFVSVGQTAQTLPEDMYQVLEREYQNTYYRLLLLEDRVAGLQAVGNCNGIGAITALIKNQTRLSELKSSLDDRYLNEKMPWSLEAAKILF